MAKIFGELFRAQFQNSPSDLDKEGPGLAYYNTFLSRLRYYTTGAWRTVATLEDGQSFSGKTELTSVAYLSSNATVTNSVLSFPSLPPKLIQRITTSSANLESIETPEGSIGTQIVLVNATSSPINLVNNKTLQTGIITGANKDLTLLPSSSVTLLYDVASLKWRVIGGVYAAIPSNKIETEAATLPSTKLTPTSTPPKLIQRITSSGGTLSTITHTGGAEASQLIIVNATQSAISVTNGAASDSATLSYGIITGTGSSIQLAPDASVTALYDPVSAKWRIVGASGSSGSVTPSPVNISEVIGATDYIRAVIEAQGTPRINISEVIGASDYIQAAIEAQGVSLPKVTGGQSLADYIKKLTPLQSDTYNAAQACVSFSKTIAKESKAFRGSVYSPLQNRIYLVPALRTDYFTYIDCESGKVEEDYHGSSSAMTANPYSGGVYSPKNNRIYLVPFESQSISYLHYIDCNTGDFKMYPKGDNTLGADAYSGGVYSPTQNRIYFIPYAQFNRPQWHYVDCNSEALVSYTPGAVGGRYFGGAYCPTKDRIYFSPVDPNTPQWHYVDCSDGQLKSYTAGVSNAVDGGYSGCVFSPIENRIYLIPHRQGPQPLWHYIDCNTGLVNSYTHGVTAVDYAYSGGVYSPLHNRIYFVPFNQATQSVWHYIDCNTSTVKSYTHGQDIQLTEAYSGGAYSPTQNKIYFSPYSNASSQHWHCISSTAKSSLDPHYFGSTVLSSTF